MQVDQIMTKPALACRTSESLATAAHDMWEQDCGVLLVVDDDGHLQGIITDRDVCMAAYTRGQLLQDVPVGDVMAKVAYSCRPTEQVSDALELMRSKQVRRIPVLDEHGHPTGIISIGDIARAVASANGPRVGVMCEDVVLTLSEICEPRAAAAHA